METLVKARRVGGSLMVRIPPEVIELEHILPEELLRIDISKAKQDWFGKFKGIGRFTSEDELTTHD